MLSSKLPPVSEGFPRELSLRAVGQRSAAGHLRAHAGHSLLRLFVLLAADLTVVLAATALVRIAREWSSLLRFLFPQGIMGGPHFVVALVLGLFVVGAYSQGDAWKAWSRVVQGTALGTGLVLWERLWSTPPALTLVRWALVTFVAGAAISFGRWTVAELVRIWRTAPNRREPVLLVSSGEEEESLRKSQIFGPKGPFRMAATVSIQEGDGYSRFWEKVLELTGGSTIGTIVVGGYINPAIWTQLLELCDVTGCRLLSLGRHRGSLLTSVTQTSYLGIPVTEVTQPHFRYHQLLLKRGMDLLVAGLGVLVLLPVFGAIAIAVKLTSPGPIFFRQERVGLGGGIFWIFKFRSMYADAEDQLERLKERSVYSDGRLFKVPDDPRITPLGRFLRRTSLDELPQLFNVLRGEMSLVGPRPPVPREVVLYEAHHYCRFDVKPGITGPWQVSGRNEITDFEEVVLLEREYIRNWSIGKDFRILFRTIPVVLRGKGAV